MPELPAQRAARYVTELGLPSERARELAFRRELAEYFEAAIAAVDGGGSDTAIQIANWIPQLVERIGSDADPAESRVTPVALAALVAMVTARQVSGTAARDVLTTLVSEGGDPAAIIERDGLGALGDDQGSGLKEIVERAIAADPDAAEKVAGGNPKAIGALVGFVMRETKGRADGGEVRRLILERLNDSGENA